MSRGQNVRILQILQNKQAVEDFKGFPDTNEKTTLNLISSPNMHQ